jgi:radical SAM superfamily enzyme YgiQ (UPF0313 family)
MTKRKITLVNTVNEGVLYRETRMPALSLAYLSAYVPKDWDVRIVDETVEKFDAYKHVSEGPDIIGISGGNVCNIPRIGRMLESIEEVGQVTGMQPAVVLGGYVGRLNLEGLPSKVDSVVSGPGELAIQRLIKDFEREQLQPVYNGVRIPMDQLKRPDFSRFNIAAYGKNINWPVQTSVSCNNECKFCSARVVFGQGYEARSVDKVLEDMSQIPDGSRVYFTDPNLVVFSNNGLKRAKELFTGMKDRRFNWFGSVSFKINEHPQLLGLMKESGCRGVLIGYDSASIASLEKVSETKVPAAGKNLLDYYVAGTRKIQEKFGIPVLGTFVVGLDTDEQSIFRNTIDVVKQSKMDDAQYLDFTPLPGTAMYDELEKAGRIFDSDYSHFDFSDVVFQPNNFTPRELRNGVVNMYDQTHPHMLKLYRRMGVIRDRPGEIRVKSMQQREREERAERQRREGNGDH